MKPHLEIPEIGPQGLRKFSYVTSAVIAVLFGLAIPGLLDLEVPAWPWVLAGIMVAWGSVAPATLKPVYRGWMRFGLVMNRVTTPVVLGIVYFFLVTPLAVLMRIKGRDPMARKLDPNCESYRLNATHAPVQKMEKPY